MSRLVVFPEREPAAPARGTVDPAAIAGELAAGGASPTRDGAGGLVAAGAPGARAS
jgi:hypothetical protein